VRNRNTTRAIVVIQSLDRAVRVELTLGKVRKAREHSLSFT
jgi:hypothetical protein